MNLRNLFQLFQPLPSCILLKLLCKHRLSFLPLCLKEFVSRKNGERAGRGREEGEKEEKEEPRPQIIFKLYNWVPEI